MEPKTNLAVIFGGRSAEHGISLISAGNIIKNLNHVRFHVIPIAIDEDGNWWTADRYEDLIYYKTDGQAALNTAKARELVLFPGKSFPIQAIDKSIPLPKIDVVFPIVHGPSGEDGTLQGLLRMLDLPFVGPDLAASAICMDKDYMKRLLSDAGIDVGTFLTLGMTDKTRFHTKDIVKELGLPLYVKPANMGSSIGISRVEEERELRVAIREAFLYDRKVLLESEIKGREIECGVIGNHHIEATTIGEIIPRDGWYSYKSKYFDEKGAMLAIPADLDDETKKRASEMALRVYRVLGLEGMSRVDMFLTESGQIVVNEVNTLPGFTDISMFPKLWERSGLYASELVDLLVNYALERHEERRALRTSPGEGLLK